MFVLRGRFYSKLYIIINHFDNDNASLYVTLICVDANICKQMLLCFAIRYNFGFTCRFSLENCPFYLFLNTFSHFTSPCPRFVPYGGTFPRRRFFLCARIRFFPSGIFFIYFLRPEEQRVRPVQKRKTRKKFNSTGKTKKIRR